MEVFYSAEMPERSTRKGARRILNYNVRELSDEEIMELWERESQEGSSYDDFARNHKYAYHSVSTGIGKWSYGGIVEAIIRDKYTTDEMEAITNNMNAIVGEFFNVLVTEGIIGATKYLLDSRDDANTDAFKEMQEWRAMAKSEARGVFKKE